MGITANIVPTNDPVPNDPSLWWWRGQSWPHVDPNVTYQKDTDPAARALRLHEYYNLNIGGDWTNAHWGPYPYARSLLPEFSHAIQPWAQISGPPISLGFPAVADAAFRLAAVDVAEAPFEALVASTVPAAGLTALEQELIELVGLMEYRPGVLAEALEQAVSIDQCFSGIITFNRITHPYTAKLVAFAIEAGTHVAILFKAFYNRPRPSQLCPTLLPPIDPPEHAAFPSGHATQAWLTALLLNTAMGGRLDPQPIVGGAFGGTGSRQNPLFDMARRISRNREILGLHYPSDSEAGRRLAHAAYATIIRRETGRIEALMTAARGEWTNLELLPLESETEWPVPPQEDGDT